MIFLAILAWSFHSVISNLYFMLLNVFTMQNVKKIYWQCHSVCSFYSIGLNFTQILPLRPHLICFLLIFKEISDGGFNKFYELVFQSSSSEKYLLRSPKIVIFCTLYAQITGQHGLHPNWKTFFYAERTKADHKLLKLYFIKIFVFSKLWIFLYFMLCFSPKIVINLDHPYLFVCLPYPNVGIITWFVRLVRYFFWVKGLNNKIIPLILISENLTTFESLYLVNS